jgi:hypothetical protein
MVVISANSRQITTMPLHQIADSVVRAKVPILDA